MISELVALASCVMLTAAQFQIPFQQVAALPNLQPMQLTSLPNSQILMMQSANSILNSDASSPLSPGILGGVPVLVSETAQSILDQESRIVGYSLPPHLFQQQQQLSPQQQQFSPLQQLIPVNTPPQIVIPSDSRITHAQNTGTARNPPQRRPQSLSIPVLNNGNHRPGNVVPVRAMASLKSLIGSNEPSDSITPSHNVAEERKPIYYDIPPNHPIPPTTSSSSQPTEYPSSRHSVQQHRQETSFNPQRGNDYTRHQNEPVNHQVNHNDEGDYLSPPPPPNRDFYRTGPNKDPTSASNQNQQRQTYHDNRERENSQSPHVRQPSQHQSITKPRNENDKSQRRKKSKSRQSKSSSSKPKATTVSPAESRNKANSKIRDDDSATDGSETSFLTALLNEYQPARPPPPSYESNNDFQNEGYASNYNERPTIHKHIFVHAAPETYPQRPRIRVVRPPIKPEQHVQIIFVKTPTEAHSPTQTIVELQPQEQPKTLVYILSKKPDDTSGKIKVVSPPVSKPPSPEIYFIRYGDRRDNQGYPVPNLESLHLNENNSDGPRNHQPVGGPDSYNSFLRNKRHKDFGLDVYAPLMAYSSSGQINEITNVEADSRKSNLDAFF